MSLERVLEPEVMDSQQDAFDYDTMDHSLVNRVFVDDLLAALQSDPNGQKEAAFSAEQPPLDILDLGTGTALIPVELCRRFKQCRVMAADAAAHMLELARYHLEVHSLTDRIQLAQVDAKDLPFEGQMFDVVMSNSILHHIPDPRVVLREAVRVVRPGGLLFFRDLLRPNSADELNHLVATYVADCNDHQRQLFADSLQAALTLGEIQSVVASLGFPPATVTRTSDRHWTWSGRLAEPC